jgi:hypothetical protein
MKNFLMVLAQACLVWGILAGFYPMVYYLQHDGITWMQVFYKFWWLTIGSYLCGLAYGVLFLNK